MTESALGIISVGSLLTLVVALQTLTLGAIFRIMANHSKLKTSFAVHTAQHNGGK